MGGGGGGWKGWGRGGGVVYKSHIVLLQQSDFSRKSTFVVTVTVHTLYIYMKLVMI